MTRTTVEVRRVGTRTGWGRDLAVEGPWTPACSARFREEDCDGISWRPPRTRRLLTCAHLTEFRPNIRRLYIVAGSHMDDRAIAELDQLEDLHALTRARNPLDLSALTRLRTFSVDDRPGLDGFAHPTIESAYFAFNERRLAELEPASALRTLKLEGSGKHHVVDLSGRLANLTHLMVQGSRVETLEGLDSPKLESLHLSDRKSDHVLDLAPLAQLSHLTWVTVVGPRDVRNAHLLREREGVNLRL